MLTMNNLCAVRAQVTANSYKAFTCIAMGQPKPVRLDWSLGDSALDINDSQSDGNNGADELVKQVGNNLGRSERKKMCYVNRSERLW